MKNIFIITGLMYCVLVSCNQKVKIYPTDRMEWSLGEGNPFEVDTCTNSIQNNLFLDMSTDGFCCNSGINITLKSETTNLFDSLITNFPFSTEITVPESSKIYINSSVRYILHSGIVCKRLGFVSCMIQL